MNKTIVFLLLLCFSFMACKKQVAEGGADFSKPNCFDGIKNQNELGIDCGGVCGTACYGVVTATVNGQNFEASGISSNVQCVIDNSTSSFQLLATDVTVPYRTIQLSYTGSFGVGVKNATGVFSIFLNGNFKPYNQNTTTTFSITNWNSQDSLVAGSFTFKGFASSTDSVVITNGEFINVRFQ